MPSTRATSFGKATPKPLFLPSRQPPTNNTLWKIGILFFLVHKDDGWHISDVHRFDAQNKAAEITCELTSGKRTEPIVTVAITRGRREWTSSQSASYSPSDTKLVRRDPEHSPET